MQRFVTAGIRCLGSRRFFYGVMIFFVLEALWVACSAAYPMAFDEQFHVEATKLYAQHWLPFLSGQPEGADSLSAIARDPSYLYHYLASFPYRLLSIVADNLAAHVMLLRLINIGVFAWALVLFSRLFRSAKVSAALTNTTLLLFVLIPVVPLVAGQAGYDPLCILLVAVMCLLTYRVVTALQQRTLDLRTLGLLAIVGFTASLVKYASVPVFGAAVLYVGFAIWRAFRGHVPQLRSALRSGYRVLNRTAKIALLTAFVLVGCLWAQRYGVNLVQYHTPLNDCDKILTEQQCEAFGPWQRDHKYAQTKGVFDTSPLHYGWRWLQGLHYRLFFMINGPHPNYANYPPLPLPAASAVAIGLSGLVGVVLYWRKIFKGRSFLGFCLLATILYGAFLFIDGYGKFLYTGRTVAINGRYLLVVLLLLAIVLGQALSVALRKWQWLKLVCATAAILLFVQGGGIFSFLVRSGPAWYWPNETILQVNQQAQRLVTPYIFKAQDRN